MSIFSNDSYQIETIESLRKDIKSLHNKEYENNIKLRNLKVMLDLLMDYLGVEYEHVHIDKEQIVKKKK